MAVSCSSVWLTVSSLYRLVDLSVAVRYEGVELDSCFLDEMTSGKVLPEEQDLEPTPDPTLLTLAPPTHLSAMTPGALLVISFLIYKWRCTHKIPSIIDLNINQYVCLLVIDLFVMQCASEAEPTFLPSAVQFGLSRHSHMAYTVNPHTVRKRSVSMTTRWAGLWSVILYMRQIL